MELEEILEDIREYPGLTEKAAMGPWAKRFKIKPGTRIAERASGPGDDAGAIETGDGYMLLAAEGLSRSLLGDPLYAGFWAVTVGVNNIYAMGGSPLGVATVISSGGFNDSDRDAFLDGLNKGLDHYRVLLLDTHTSPDEGERSVAVSSVGKAVKPLRGSGAEPGDELLVMLDLSGKKHPKLYFWNSALEAESETTLRMLGALVELADLELCSACRGISSAGLLGTLAMMLEASGCGANIFLEWIPKPESIGLAWWLKARHSYGFLLSVPGRKIEDAEKVLDSRGVKWARIGQCMSGAKITVEWQGETAVFLNWKKQPITGLF